ncbi:MULTISPECIES: DUF302 domain-containing protein [Halomonadaceae]|uniref:DUF302 domain-containing protein n=1 Tax=Vreelandella halophila TaxID=86177 RepID=A0A9X4YA91_9GAMM|nr:MULTISPECIES: DUF302 domain-containing protein [Halomonas]MYL26049.1 DUF302 domain-containing protein [Halomonas utahensis]MYL73389.1 DUF302 domain-containing protein [Halomonas sp. 22501_18_FS]
MFRVASDYSPKETVERLKEAISTEGMYLLCHIPASTNVAHVGLESPFHQVLEVFHPAYAARVWEAREDAGIAIPVRGHVYESVAGGVRVDWQRPSVNLGLFPEPELATIGRELDPVFERIVHSVGTEPETL